MLAFWLCTLHIFGSFAIFRCYSSLWDFVYVYSHIVYSQSSTVSAFFRFWLWPSSIVYFTLCIIQFLTVDSSCVDSSCLTGYEPCALVAPNLLSLLSLKEIFSLHFPPSIHLQTLLLLTPCPQNTKLTRITSRPSLEPTTSSGVRRWRPFFAPKASGDLWMARSLALPLQAQSRLLGTSSRTE